MCETQVKISLTQAVTTARRTELRSMPGLVAFVHDQQFALLKTNALIRHFCAGSPEMLGLRARREFGSRRVPDSAKRQTTPDAARDQFGGPKCDGLADRQ